MRPNVLSRVYISYLSVYLYIFYTLIAIEKMLKLLGHCSIKTNERARSRTARVIWEIWRYCYYIMRARVLCLMIIRL